MPDTLCFSPICDPEVAVSPVFGRRPKEAAVRDFTFCGNTIR
jgi:hypothetical protein